MQSSNFQSQSYRQQQITRDLNGIRNSGGIVNGGLVTFLTLMALTYSVSAGEFNEVLSLGDQAPIWSNLPGTDGKQHSMSDDHDKTAIVLVFTSATCPTAIEYESRINEMAERMAGPGRQIALVAVCVNRVNGDQLSDLTERVKSKNLKFVYLYDETQKIAKDYGAIFTPEFYVLDRDRKIAYMGAFDDHADPEKVRRRHVEEAILSVLKGKVPEVQETIGRGCRVRYLRERK
jgi:peroxiredoxin